MKKLKALALFSATLISSQAVTVRIDGLTEAPINGLDGTPLQDGSIVQVGFFLGIDAAQLPSTYTQADWDTFQVLDSNTVIDSSFGLGDGTFVLDGLEFETDTDFGNPSETPVRTGVRIFDAVGSVDGSSLFNTYSSDNFVFILEEVNGTPPDPFSGNADVSIGSEADAGLVWEDNANPFQTSIAAIPEPSTSLSALLGLGLLIGSRRRK